MSRYVGGFFGFFTPVNRTNGGTDLTIFQNLTLISPKMVQKVVFRPNELNKSC